jgi:hypothetical protein
MERAEAACCGRSAIRVISAIALAGSEGACRVDADPHHPSPLLATDNSSRGGVEDVTGANAKA